MLTNKTASKPITIQIDWFFRHKVLYAVILGLLIFVTSLFAWLFHRYTRPEQTWNGMFNVMLSTPSVTRRTVSNQGGQSVEQITQLNYVNESTSHGLVVVEQKNNGAPSDKIITETVGTNKAEYSRYVRIQTSQKNANGKPYDYSSVENIWGKAEAKDLGDASPRSNLQRANLGLIPSANIAAAARQRLVSGLNNGKTYKVDYKKAKSEVIEGKAVWTYPVEVNIGLYLPIIKQLFIQSGLGDAPDLDPRVYASSPPQKFTVSIDKFSRQIIQFKYEDGSTELLSGYGIQQGVSIPVSSIPYSQLQSKIQSIR